MKKKISLIAFLLCVSFCGFATEIDGICYRLSYNVASVTNSSTSDYYSGDIVIPEFVVYNDATYRVEGINDNAFSSCTKLTSVIIPESVVSIGKEAFRGCNNLTSVVIPKSVSEIGGYAFQNCTNLTSIIIPESITKIGQSVFWNCTNLTTLVFNAQNLTEASGLFSDLPIKTLIIGEKVKVIPGYIFNGCKAISSITIPNSVKRIGNGAFKECSNLTDVIIGDSVKIIGDYAFQNCTNLKNVTLGSNVSYIGDYAFNGDKNIRTIISKNVTPPVCGKYVFKSVKVESATLIVPQESISLYETADTWRDFWNISGKDFSNIESTFADSEVNVSVENGNIIVNDANNENIKVYSVSGQCVYSGNATTIPVSAKGLYLVKVNGKSFKVML